MRFHCGNEVSRIDRLKKIAKMNMLRGPESTLLRPTLSWVKINFITFRGLIRCNLLWNPRTAMTFNAENILKICIVYDTFDFT